MLYSYKTIEGFEHPSSGGVYCELRLMIVTIDPLANPFDFITQLAMKDFSPVDNIEIEVFDNIDRSEIPEETNYSFKGKTLQTTIHDIRKIPFTALDAQILDNLNECPEELYSFSFIADDKETYLKFSETPMTAEGIPVELLEDTNRYFLTFL